MSGNVIQLDDYRSAATFKTGDTELPETHDAQIIKFPRAEFTAKEMKSLIESIMADTHPRMHDNLARE